MIWLLNLKKGDKVVVLAGKDKGQEGTIRSVDPKAGKAVVDGINIAIRATRQSQTSQGGRIPKRCRSSLATWRCRCKRQSNPRWLQDGRRQESALRKNHGDVI